MFRWSGNKRDPSPDDGKRRKKDSTSRSSRKAESVASAPASRHRSSRGEDHKESRKSSSRSVADDTRSRAGDFESEDDAATREPKRSTSRRSVTWDASSSKDDRAKERREDRRSSRSVDESSKARASSRHDDSDDEPRPLKRSATYDSPQSSRNDENTSITRERTRSDDKSPRKSSRTSTDDTKDTDKRSSKQKSSSSSSSRAAGKSRARDESEQGEPSSRPSQSNLIANQFPDQTPLNYASSALPGQPEFGEAAEYYGDQGQSVAHQPGVRPGTPIIVGAEPHLQPASAEPAPAQDTGNGAAAEFFADADDDFGSGATMSNSTSQQTSATAASGRPPNSGKPASSSFLGRLSSGSSSKPSGRPEPSKPAGRPDSSRPSKMTAAAMAVGAAGAAGFAANAFGKTSHQQTFQTQSTSASGGRTSAGGSSSNRPSRPSASTIQPSSSQSQGQAHTQTSTTSYHSHQHHHHGHGAAGRPRAGSGPLDQLVNWWNDYEDVAKMEAYTEYIGVCKHCFDPRSTPADAPRIHVPRRVRSRDSMESVRVDKERRYSRTEASRRRQRRDASWLGAGLAGIGLAQAARAVDGYGSASSSGRSTPEMSTSFAAGRRDPAATRQSSQEVSKRTSAGVQQTSNSARPMIEVDPRPVSETRITSGQRRSSRDAIAVGAVGVMGAAALATHDRRSTARQDDKQPESPSSSSSSDDDVGFFGRVFGRTPTKEKKRPPRRRRSSGTGRLYNLPSSSASSASVDSSLAFGGAGRGRLASPTRKAAPRKRRSSDEMARNALIGLGTAAAALAAHKANGTRRSPAAQEPYPLGPARLGKQRDSRPSAVQGPVYAGSDEDEWESDMSQSSGERHQDLAFGDGIAMTDLENDSQSEHSETEQASAAKVPAQRMTPRTTRNGNVFMGSSPEEPRIVRSTEADRIDVKAPQSRRPVQKDHLERFDPDSPSSKRARQGSEQSPHSLGRSQTFPMAAQQLPPSILKSSTSRDWRRRYSSSEEASEDDYIPRRRKEDRDDGDRHSVTPSKESARIVDREETSKTRYEPQISEPDTTEFDVPGSFPSGKAAAAALAGAGAIAAASAFSSKKPRQQEKADTKRQRPEPEQEAEFAKPRQDENFFEASQFPGSTGDDDWRRERTTRRKDDIEDTNDTRTIREDAHDTQHDDSYDQTQREDDSRSTEFVQRFTSEQDREPGETFEEAKEQPAPQQTYQTQVRRPKPRPANDEPPSSESSGAPHKSAFSSRATAAEEARQRDPRGSPAPENWNPPAGVPRLIFPSRDPSPDHFTMNINPRLIHPEDGNIFMNPAKSASTSSKLKTSTSAADDLHQETESPDSHTPRSKATDDTMPERFPQTTLPGSLPEDETAVQGEARELNDAHEDSEQDKDGFITKDSKKSKKKKRQSLKKEANKLERNPNPSQDNSSNAVPDSNVAGSLASIAGAGATATALSKFSFPAHQSGDKQEETHKLQRSKSSDLAEIVAQAYQAANNDESLASNAPKHARSETSRRVPQMSDIVSQAQQSSKREPDSGMDQSPQGPWNTQVPDQSQQSTLPSDRSSRSEGFSPRSESPAGKTEVREAMSRLDTSDKVDAAKEATADMYHYNSDRNTWPSSSRSFIVSDEQAASLENKTSQDDALDPAADPFPGAITEEELYNRYALSASDSKHGSPTEVRTAPSSRTPASRGPRPARVPSSTSVPVRFRTPRAASTSIVPTAESPLPSPNIVDSSPAQTPTRPPRSSRPSSTDFKSSKDIRPLYLVERNRTVENVNETLPSLPSSRSTSRSSRSASAHDTEDAYESAVEEHDPAKATDDEDFASVHEGPREQEHELLSSGQTTPKAGRTPVQSPSASLSSYNTALGKSHDGSPDGLRLSPEPGPAVESSSSVLPFAVGTSGALVAAAAAIHSHQRAEVAKASMETGKEPAATVPTAETNEVSDAEARSFAYDPALPPDDAEPEDAAEEEQEHEMFLSKAEMKRRKKEAKKGLRLSLSAPKGETLAEQSNAPEPESTREESLVTAELRRDADRDQNQPIDPVQDTLESAKMSKKEKRRSKRASQLNFDALMEDSSAPPYPSQAASDAPSQQTMPSDGTDMPSDIKAEDTGTPVVAKLSKKEKRKSKQAQRFTALDDDFSSATDAPKDLATTPDETKLAHERGNDAARETQTEDFEDFAPVKKSRKEKRNSKQIIASQSKEPDESWRPLREENADQDFETLGETKLKVSTDEVGIKPEPLSSDESRTSTEDVAASGDQDSLETAQSAKTVSQVSNLADQALFASPTTIEQPLQLTQSPVEDAPAPETVNEESGEQQQQTSLSRTSSKRSSKSTKEKRKSTSDEKPGKSDKKDSKPLLTGAGAFAAGVLGLIGGRKPSVRSSSSSSRKRDESADSRRYESSRKSADRKSSKSRPRSSRDIASPVEPVHDFNSTLRAAEAALRDDEEEEPAPASSPIDSPETFTEHSREPADIVTESTPAHPTGILHMPNSSGPHPSLPEMNIESAGLHTAVEPDDGERSERSPGQLSLDMPSDRKEDEDFFVSATPSMAENDFQDAQEDIERPGHASGNASTAEDSVDDVPKDSNDQLNPLHRHEVDKTDNEKRLPVSPLAIVGLPEKDESGIFSDLKSRDIGDLSASKPPDSASKASFDDIVTAAIGTSGFTAAAMSVGPSSSNSPRRAQSIRADSPSQRYLNSRNASPVREGELAMPSVNKGGVESNMTFDDVVHATMMSSGFDPKTVSRKTSDEQLESSKLDDLKEKPRSGSPSDLWQGNDATNEGATHDDKWEPASGKTKKGKKPKKSQSSFDKSESMTVVARATDEGSNAESISRDTVLNPAEAQTVEEPQSDALASNSQPEKTSEQAEGPKDDFGEWAPSSAKKSKKQKRKSKEVSFNEDEPSSEQVDGAAAVLGIATVGAVAANAWESSQSDNINMAPHSDKDKAESEGHPTDNSPSEPQDALVTQGPNTTAETQTEDWSKPLSAKEQKKLKKAQKSQRAQSIDDVVPEHELPASEALDKNADVKMAEAASDDPVALSSSSIGKDEVAQSDALRSLEPPVEADQAEWDVPLSNKDKKKLKKAKKAEQKRASLVSLEDVDDDGVRQSALRSTSSDRQLPINAETSMPADEFNSSPVDDDTAQSQDVAAPSEEPLDKKWAPPMSAKERKKLKKAQKASSTEATGSIDVAAQQLGREGQHAIGEATEGAHEEKQTDKPIPSSPRTSIPGAWDEDEAFSGHPHAAGKTADPDGSTSNKNKQQAKKDMAQKRRSVTFADDVEMLEAPLPSDEEPDYDTTLEDQAESIQSSQSSRASDEKGPTERESRTIDFAAAALPVGITAAGALALDQAIDRNKQEQETSRKLIEQDSDKPRAEQLEQDLQEDDFSVPLSKKERKKRQKAAEKARSSGEFDSEFERDASAPKLEDETTKSQDVESPSVDPKEELSKKAQRIRDLAARFESPPTEAAEALPQSSSSIQTGNEGAFESSEPEATAEETEPKVPEQKEWTPPLSNKEKKKLKKARKSQQFGGSDPPLANPEDASLRYAEESKESEDPVALQRDAQTMEWEFTNANHEGNGSTSAEALEPGPTDFENDVDFKPSEQTTAADGNEDEPSDPWAAPLSNKEKKKQRKAQKAERNDAQPELTTSTSNDDVSRELEQGRKAKDDDFDEYTASGATDRDNMTQGQDDEWAPPLSKKDKKKQKKAEEAKEEQQRRSISDAVPLAAIAVPALLGTEPDAENGPKEDDGDSFAVQAKEADPVDEFPAPLSAKERKKLKKAQKSQSISEKSPGQDSLAAEQAKESSSENTRAVSAPAIDAAAVAEEQPYVDVNPTQPKGDDWAWSDTKNANKQSTEQSQDVDMRDAPAFVNVKDLPETPNDGISPKTTEIANYESREPIKENDGDVAMTGNDAAATDDWTVPLSAKEKKKLKKANKSQSKIDELERAEESLEATAEPNKILDKENNPFETQAAEAMHEQSKSAPLIDAEAKAEEQPLDDRDAELNDWTAPLSAKDKKKLKKAKKSKSGSEPFVPVDDVDPATQHVTAKELVQEPETFDSEPQESEFHDHAAPAIDADAVAEAQPMGQDQPEEFPVPLSNKEKKRLKKQKKSQSNSEPLLLADDAPRTAEAGLPDNDGQSDDVQTSRPEPTSRSGEPTGADAFTEEVKPADNDEVEEWNAPLSAKEKKKLKKAKRAAEVFVPADDNVAATRDAPTERSRDNSDEPRNETEPPSWIDAEAVAEEQPPRPGDPEFDEWSAPMSSKEKKKLKKAQKTANRTSTESAHDRQHEKQRDVLAGAATVAAIGAAAAAFSRHTSSNEDQPTETQDQLDSEASKTEQQGRLEPTRHERTIADEDSSMPDAAQEKEQAERPEQKTEQPPHEEQAFIDISHKSNKKNKKKNRRSAVAWNDVVEEAEQSHPWDMANEQQQRDSTENPQPKPTSGDYESQPRDFDNEHLEDLEEGKREHDDEDKDQRMEDVPDSWDAEPDEPRSEQEAGHGMVSDHRRYEVTPSDAAAMLSQTPVNQSSEDGPFYEGRSKQVDVETERRLTGASDDDTPDLSIRRARPSASNASPERKEALASIPELSREPTSRLPEQLQGEEEGWSLRSPEAPRAGLTSAALKGLDDEDEAVDWHERSLHPDDSISAVGSRVASREQSTPKGSELANTRRAYIRSPGQETREAIIRPKSAQSSHSRAGSTTSTHSGTLRRSGQPRSVSSDLRAANKRDAAVALASSGKASGALATASSQTPQPPANYEPLRGPGKDRRQDMSDGGVYEAWGDARSSPRSPTKPQSIRKRQSTQILELEAQLEDMRSQNKSLQDARSRSRQGYDSPEPSTPDVLQRSIQSRDESLREKDVEIETIKSSLSTLHEEISRLTEHNEQLQSANDNLTADVNGRYKSLQTERDEAHSQWQESSRQLADLNERHEHLSGGMESIVQEQIQAALAEKNAQIKSLRVELDEATDRIEELQRQIQSAGGVLTIRDVDYFDSACQQLCQHVQQWVLRFSKFSDTKMCRLSGQLEDEGIETRLDNTILDGSDVDDLLSDRVRRRDVFMSLVMTMIWEFIFTRYLSGLDREQRQKLKSLEKTLSEVGPQRAVAQWRATTLTLLSRREAFAEQRANDTEAICHEIYSTLERLLPPPRHLAQQIQDSLRKVLSLAVDISIEMRTQRAEYVMLPPLQPEYDTNGDLARKVYFNAALMNERSGETASNEELEEQEAVLRVVLFPLVVKKGDDMGEGNEEVVVCPAQVLIARSDARRVMGHGNHSMASIAPSTMPGAGEEDREMV